jgi:hypothetical protein
MFDLDQFVADCRTAIAQDPSHGEPKRSNSLRAGFTRWQRHGSTDVRHAMR